MSGVNVGSAYGEIILGTGGASKGIRDIQGSLGGLQGGFMGVNPLIGAFGVGIAGVTAVVGGFTAAIGTSVAKAADLESQLDSIQASMGITSKAKPKG